MAASMPESSSRNRSDSLDDPELPEQERKRPRLNSSKPDAVEAMADAAMIPPTPTSDTSNGESNHDRQLTPPSSTNSSEANTATSPTSKVTINTRALQSQSSFQAESQANPKSTGASLETSTATSMTAEHLNDSAMSAGQADSNSGLPDTISISSSPSRSPAIEVAEIEDYDQEPSQTKWTSLTRSNRNPVAKPYLPYYVNQTFPYVARRFPPGSSHKILADIASCFLTGHERDGIVFQELKSWLADFLQEHDHLDRNFILQEANFWREFPELIGNLLKREIDAPTEARPQDLENFFVDYGRLIVLLVKLDLRQLRSYNDKTDPKDIAELFCRPYLSTLTWILQYSGIPFYDTLLKSRSYNPANLISAIADKLADTKSINILHFLAEVSIELATVLPKKPAYTPVFLQILTAASQFIKSIPERAAQKADAIYQASPQLEDIKENSLQFFLGADELLQTAIVKQVPWLTIDNSSDILRIMSRSMQCIADELVSFRSDIIISAGVTVDGFDFNENMQDVAAFAWKFKTLRKYVTNGRMEIRVHGIDAMQNELVYVFQCHIRNNPDFMGVPLVRFLVKFIQETKLINYIIGVDSHPQIICRSNNIVGFLCVTHTYTDSETDIMWKTVLESQDPRTSVGVLELLRGDFAMLELPALHYLCSKLLVLPLQRFDGRMLDFTAEILDSIRQKPQSGNGLNEPYDPITIALCIRLLRDASGAENCTPDQLLYFFRVASEQLMCLIRPGWLGGPLRVDTQEQEKQWRQIAEDVANNNKFATGSIQAMTAWIHGMSADDAGLLLLESGVTELLINNIAHLSEQCMSGRVQENSIEVAFNIRIDALSYVVIRVPETLTSELMECLWTHLFTAGHLPKEIRGKAWAHLSNVVKNPHGDQNSVIDMIINEYLPRLRPHDLSFEVLELIQYCVRYETRMARSLGVDEAEIVTIPGIERVWQVMLEAPPGTVEANATDFIIRQYLDNELITKKSKVCIRATHMSLVDRCVQQVIASAAKLKSYSDGTMSGEDEPMVIIASEDEINAEELRFDRSLLFLRKFLEGMKARPRYSPPPIKDANGGQAQFESRGDTFEVKLQVFGSKRFSTESISLILGCSNSGSELWQYLSEMTGFLHFQVLCGGQKILLKDSSESLAELNVKPGRVIVHKTVDTPEREPLPNHRAASPVDTKVMDHFQELYDLLALEERLASQVYSFLTLFGAQAGVLNLVRSMKASPDKLLPADKPYQLLYCAQALRSCMEEQSFSSSPDVEFVRYGITTIIATFPRLETSGSDDTLQMSTAQSLLESLLLGFRARVATEVSRTYIDDHESYLKHLLRIASNGRECGTVAALQGYIRPQNLVREPLEAIVEGALHDERVWTCLKSNRDTDKVLRNTLLTDPRTEVRRAVADIFLNLSGWTGAKLVLKVNDPRAARSRFAVEVIDSALGSTWTSLRKLLPEAVSWPFRCHELFETAVAIIRRIGKTFSISELTSYFEEWSSLLASYRHKENVGQKVDDHVVWGFTKLLQECCKSLRLVGALIPANNLAKDLMSNFLFPELSPTSGDSDGFGMPVLSSTTREDLYELVLLLSQDRDELDVVVSSLDDIVAKDHFFEPNLSYDRQSLRSEVGYAGLKNLSNTCYLNSLFSQLFMNVQFRDFLLRTNVVDESKQKLVAQLAKVFANMQNSYERYVDPTHAVESIAIPAMGGQDEQIDVAVQMDVDEFYNILFDQLERQILDPELRKRFKSLYGGQLVQQVKSRECEHISERVEPFSNIQIEIKGKRGLEEGLKAYVEGEILQGDNKYSCTSCGKHVDAVKRACLKDMPDSLIFNLKRFDYDIITGTRCKINDEFQFPDTIDMAPYTVEYLSDPEKSVSADTFELTGVIVHAGTADSGHYYSYIRQRPSSKDKNDSWVQFNDTEVSPFDPATIKDNCFGGIDMGSAFQWSKIYSAYMLFYQRTSSIKKFEKRYPQKDPLNPVRLQLPGELERHLRQQNELFIRCYCAQDPSHAKFMRLLLERIQNDPNHRCDADHEFENKLLIVVLEYIQQVSSRWKEHPEFEATVKILKNNATRCTCCATTIFDWFVREEVVKDSMLRSPYPMVRRALVGLVCQVLSKVSKAAKDEHPTIGEEPQQNGLYKAYLRTFREFAFQVIELWDEFQRFGRAWNDYFDLLTAMVKLGYDEAEVVLEFKGLEILMDLVYIHCGAVTKKQKAKWQVYLTLREKNRPYGLNSFVECLEAVLGWLDLKRISNDDTRYRDDHSFGVTIVEASNLGLTSSPSRTTPEFEWLRRLIIGRQNPLATQRIMRHLIRDNGLVRYVFRVLEMGLAEEQIGNAAAFLEPTLFFISHCTVASFINKLVKSSLEGIETISSQYGKEHLDYVMNLLKAENEDLDMASDHFEREVLVTIGLWAPVLLIYPNNDLHTDVRRDTADVIRYLVFAPLSESQDPQEVSYLRRAAKKLAFCGAQYANKNFVDAPAKDRATLQANQANVFFEVIEHCLQYFDLSNAQDEHRVAEITEMLDALRAKAAEAVETLSTSWADGESDVADVSEFASDVASP